MRDPGKATDPLAALLQAESRGDIREGGAWLDGAGRSWRALLVAESQRRGAVFPDDWPDLDGKRLLRLALARGEGAQVRTTPISRDEAFVCTNCGRDVPLGGRRPRDHCPWCLYSKHVDVVPGDRAADCGGALVPVGLVPAPKGMMIEYRCGTCGSLRRNRVLDDLVPPDDPGALRAVAAGSLG